MSVQFYLMQDYLPKALSTPMRFMRVWMDWIFFSDLLATAFLLLVDLPHIFYSLYFKTWFNIRLECKFLLVIIIFFIYFVTL